MPSAVRIESAIDFGDGSLRAAMNAAFSDYAVPMHLSEAAFSLMMRQRGWNRSASRVVVVEDTIAGVWLVSVRGTRAYLIASGTQEAYRRRGLARRLGESCLAHLKRLPVESLQAEVFTTNDRAHALYRSLGMTTLRKLHCYSIEPVTEPWEDQDVLAVPWPSVAARVSGIWDIRPSWQNDIASLNAISDRVACHAIEDRDGLAAYAAIIPESSTLAQIAVREDRRRNGLATRLIRSLTSNGEARQTRILNVDSAAKSATTFLASVNAKQTVSQYELTLAL